MRKIGYFKFVSFMAFKDGVYEYIIDPESGYIGIINPVRENGEDHSWDANENDIEIGYREGERGAYIFSEHCEIFPVSPALKILYGFNNTVPKGD